MVLSSHLQGGYANPWHHDPEDRDLQGIAAPPTFEPVDQNSQLQGALPRRQNELALMPTEGVTGADEVITLGGGWLRVWGARHAESRTVPEPDPGMIRHKVTNHTHN